MINNMAHYIDKDALVTEIERIEHETNYEPFTDEVLGKRCVCKSLLSLINTLEVKEVDLKKELSLEDYKSFFKKHPDLSNDWGFDEAWIFANYFFELGQKGGYFSTGFATGEPCFRELAQPLVEYLRKNYHPHAKIIIEDDGAEIVVGVLGEPFPIE